MTQPATPTTQSGQLAGLFAALKVTDFAAAMAAIGNFDAAGNWQNDQKAIFGALGATDQAGAITEITRLKTEKPKGEKDDEDKKDDEEKAALWAQLGVTEHTAAMTAVSGLKVTSTNYTGLLAIIGAPDQNAAIVAIGTMRGAQGNHDALVKALGATDHGSAVTAATNLEATVSKRVKERAASAGLGEPVPKGSAEDQPGTTQRAVTPRSRLAATFNAQLSRTATTGAQS